MMEGVERSAATVAPERGLSERVDHVPLDRIRSVGSVINDTLDYIRTYGAIMKPTLLRVILPMFLFSQVVWAVYNTRITGMLQSLSNPWGGAPEGFSTGSENFDTLLIIAGVVATFVAFSLAIAAGYAFLRLLEGRDFEAEGPPTLEEFNREYTELRSTVIGTNIGLMLLGGAAFLGYGFLVAIPLLGRLIFLLGLVVIPFFLVRFSLYYPARFIEETSLTGALSRSSDIVRGAWWQTFGLLVAATLLVWVISMIAFIPSFVAAIFSPLGFAAFMVEDSSLGIAVQVLTGLLSGVVSMIGTTTYLFIGVYFCSRREEVEGGSIMAALRTIGPDDPETPNEEQGVAIGA